MTIKKVLFILLAILSIGNALAIDQIGIAYRYNGKKQRTPLGGVYIKVATSPNGVVSQEQNGQFVLKLKDIKMGDAMGNAIVQKTGMMVFNKEEVNRWSVQRKPLVLIICDADEFQKQKEHLIAIGRNQAEKKYKQKIELLKAQNAKQQLSLDQYYAKLDSIEKEKNNALAHMDEYADMFARIDESEIDTLAQRAIELFNQGQLEESIKLFEQGNYLKKLDDALKVKAQGENLRQKGDSAVTLANKDIDEYTKSILAQVAAYKMKNEWDKAGELLKALADKLNSLDAIFNYAVFARLQNQYAEAETYYKLCKGKIAVLKMSNPEVYESRSAAICNDLGLIYYKMRRFIESEKMYKAAMEKIERLTESNPLVYEPYLVSIYNNLAILYWATQHFTESEQMNIFALIIHKPLAESNPQVYEPTLAFIYNNLAILYSDTQRFSDSEKMLKSALNIFKRLAETNPIVYEPSLAANYNNLGLLYKNIQRYAESEQMYNSALEIRKRLAESNPQAYEPDMATSYNNLGILYSDTKRYAECEKMYNSALEIRKRLAESNPQAYEPDMATSYNNLGILYSDTKRFVESEKMYKTAMEICKWLTESNPQAYGPDLATTYDHLAHLYWASQRPAESEQMFKLALGILKHLVEANSQDIEPTLAISYQSLASLYYDTQRYVESEQMHKAALQIRKRLAESNPQTNEPDLATSYNYLAGLYYDTQRYAESEQMNKAAITIYERLYKAAPQQYQSQLAVGCYWYGMSKIKSSKYHDAITQFERSLKLCKDMMKDETGKALYVLNLACLVDLYSNDKDYTTAYTYNKELLPLLKANYGEDADTWKSGYCGKLISQSFYANLLGKFEEGELHSLEALKVDSTQHLTYTNLAAAYLLQGKYQAAENLYRQYKNEFKDGLLTDFDELAKVGVIPVERLADVEKIKKMLNE